MKRKQAVAILGVAAATFALPATAQMSMSNAYLGGSIGQSKAKDACEGASNCDDKDTAWRLFGGYQFNRWFALEGGYIDLGEIEPNRAGASLEADTFYVAAVGTIPVNDAFAVYGKVGVHRWNADTGLAVIACCEAMGGR